jgi:hypothetical protein
MVSPGSTIRRTDGVVEAQFDEIRVVLNEDLAYLGLNKVGQRIWDLIESPQTLASLVDQLVAEYDVDEADCTRDVSRYVEALVEHKLVRVS